MPWGTYTDNYGYTHPTYIPKGETPSSIVTVQEGATSAGEAMAQAGVPFPEEYEPIPEPPEEKEKKEKAKEIGRLELGEEVKPASLPPNPFNAIRSWVLTGVQWLTEAATLCYRHETLFGWLGDLFVGMQNVAVGVQAGLWDAANWWDDAAARVLKILDWSTIWEYIKAYLPNWNKIGQFFLEWVDIVWGIISDWFEPAWSMIQDLIDNARQLPMLLIDSLRDRVTGLAGDVQEFFSRLPGIDEVISWWSGRLSWVLGAIDDWWDDKVADVQGLIDSGFLARDSLWAGWQDLRNQVAEFFDDPVEYIWDRFTDWFLGPEG